MGLGLLPVRVGHVEHDGEDAARPAEISLPDGMTGKALEGRVQHPGNALHVLKGPRNRKRALLVTRQPHAHGAQAAQGHVGIVGRRANAEHREGLLDGGPCGLVGRHCADQDVRVPCGIFGGRVDGNVDAMIERLEIERCCPGGCPSTPAHRARAPPRRWPGYPASRTCSSPAPRCAPAWCSAASRLRCWRR